MTDKPDFIEFLYGKEYAEKSKKIDEGLKEMDIKYSDWLGEQEPKYPGKKPSITHYRTSFYDPQRGLNLSFDEKLPDQIKQDVIALYDSIFDRKS